MSLPLLVLDVCTSVYPSLAILPDVIQRRYLPFVSGDKFIQLPAGFFFYTGYDLAVVFSFDYDCIVIALTIVCYYRIAVMYPVVRLFQAFVLHAGKLVTSVFLIFKQFDAFFAEYFAGSVQTAGLFEFPVLPVYDQYAGKNGYTDE